VQATFALSLFSKSCHYEQWSIDGAVAFHEGRLVCVGVVLIVEAVGQHGRKTNLMVIGYDRYRAVAVTLCGSAFFERCW
jgi:hypothetical protein